MLKKALKKGGIVIIFSLVFFFLFLSPYFLFAQERKLEIEYPEIFGLKPETIKTGLPQYAKYIFNLAVMIVGLILLAVFIWGGILYLTSAGNVAKLGEAKERMASAFFGVVLLLSAYIILTTINPQLVIFELPFLEKIIPPAYQPSEYKSEGKTWTFWEIPLGQMIEKNLWEKERTNKLKDLLRDLEDFFEQEIIIDSQHIKGFSGLNKYLQNLTNSCNCGKLESICKGESCSPAGCNGDPCQGVRDQINNVLKINGEKAKELSAFKEKLIELKNLFEEEGRKYRELNEDILEGKCKSKGFLMSRVDYYDSVALIEELGGKTELKRLYLPAGDDPLVFYCSASEENNYPQSREEILPEELERAKNLVPEVFEAEPLSCPGFIPTGELIQLITTASFKTNSGLEELIYYIDKILAELTKMTEFVSQCNASRCNANCALTADACVSFGCNGAPCPQGEINDTVKRIEIYEEEILGEKDQGGLSLFIKGGLLASIKESIDDAQKILEAKEKDKIDLNMLRAEIQTCLSLGASTAFPEKPREESFWTLLPCEAAIGNKGPDGNIITSCHPQSLYCCTTKSPEESPFSSATQKIRPPVSTPPPPPGGYYPPSDYGLNNVPYFSQLDPNWKNTPFGPCGETIGESGCGPTSMAMVLNFFGHKTDPPSMAKWVVENNFMGCKVGTYGGFCCKAVEAFGKEAGLKCKALHGNVEAVLNELRKGDRIAIVSGKDSTPPYTSAGHYIVLTGIVKEAGEEYVYYNDPLPLKGRPAQSRKPIDWFEEKGIRVGCVIYKE